MRYSALILASSLTLHGYDDHITVAMEAATETADDLNQDLTFLEIKHDIRPQRLLRSDVTTADEERMEWIEALTSHTKPDDIFREIREISGQSTHHGNVENILATMQKKRMSFAFKIFKWHGLHLADRFIAEWGMAPVASALVQAKASRDPIVKKMGKKLLKSLMKSFHKQAKGDYGVVFNLLHLNARDQQHLGFTDGRIELLEEYIKRKPNRQSTEDALFETLRVGFESYENLAFFIGRAQIDQRTVDIARAFEERFMKYFLAHRHNSVTFFKRLRLQRYDYQLFNKEEYQMLKRYRLLEGEPVDPQSMLDLLIQGFDGEGHLAVALSVGFSKGVANSDFGSTAADFENMLFQRFKDEGKVPDDIGTIIERDDMGSVPAATFIERYRQWFDKQPVRRL